MAIYQNKKKIRSLTDQKFPLLSFIYYSYGNKWQLLIKRLCKLLSIKLIHVQHGMFDIENSIHSGSGTSLEELRLEKNRAVFERTLSAYNTISSENYRGGKCIKNIPFVPLFMKNKRRNIESINRIGITIANDSFKLLENKEILENLYTKVASYLSLKGFELLVRDRGEQLSFLEYSFDSSNSFKEFASQVDAIVTTKSTVVYEAASMGVPVILLNTSVAPVYLPCIAILSPGSDPSYLDSVCFNKDSLGSALVFQEAVLKSLVFHHEDIDT